MLLRITRFFVYSNLFIAVCGILMVTQTSLLLLHHQPNSLLLVFVASSTLCSYSFHWFLTADSVLPSPRITWLHRFRWIHALFFLVSLPVAAVSFLDLRDYWPWLGFAMIATFLYSAPKIPHAVFRALRKVALGKTIFLAFVWTFVTAVLPIVVDGDHWSTDRVFFVAGRFFLIYAICILFDYRDRADDRAAGIRSLITYLSDTGISILFFGSLAIFTGTTVALYFLGHRVIDIVVLLIPGLVTGALYNYARTHFEDLFYYLALDGLMALSAILLLIARI